MNGAEDETQMIDRQRQYINSKKIIKDLREQLKEHKRINQFFQNAK
jgi:hypothetical protein